MIFSDNSLSVLTRESMLSTVKLCVPNPSICYFYSSKLLCFYLRMSVLLSNLLSWSFISSVLSAIIFESFCILVLRSIRDLRAISDVATTSCEIISTLESNSLFYLSFPSPTYYLSFAFLSWIYWYYYFPYPYAAPPAAAANPVIFPAALPGWKNPDD